MSLPDCPCLVMEFEKLFLENNLQKELAYFYLSWEFHDKGIFIL